jgi:CDP-glycerol glycerophosphotransferase
MPLTAPPLFAPDLSLYEQQRGFYFDYRATVPGPVLKTVDEVFSALGGLDEITKEYQSKYTSWQKRFNPLEDGHATQRVIDIVFGS